MGTVGTFFSIRDELDSEFISDVRSGDHILVDVPDMSGYKGNFMAKADGVKVYIFCYEFGYVVCVTDPDLTVVSCKVTITYGDFPEMTRRPDVVLAEMIMDRSLVYIDVLAVDGDGRLPKTMDRYKIGLRTERPVMIYRQVWDTIPSMIMLEFESMPNDEVMLVNQLRIIRLKAPTVDLLYSDGNLSALDDALMVEVTEVHPSMQQDTIYETHVLKAEDEKTILLMRPRQRMLKKVPNSPDVVKRAVASANNDSTMTITLLDITSMSFTMRERVYTMARGRHP